MGLVYVDELLKRIIIKLMLYLFLRGVEKGVYIDSGIGDGF